MKLNSNFAILDVHLRGQTGLRGSGLVEKRLKAGEKIPIVIRGYIDDFNGNDDGVSREYCVVVDEAEIADPGGARHGAP